MKKLLKWLLRILISLVILVALTAVILPMVLDPNDYKQDIEDKIQQNIGRQAHLEGDIEWSVFPWLALTFNDVSIDNAKGFKGDKFAKIQKLSARVKLLPLLSKDIKVGSIVIDGAELTLQVSSSGTSNWQSILDNLDADSDDTDSSASTATLNIEGVKLSNININYKDSQTITHANITNLSMDMSEISKNTTVNTDITMHLQMPDTGLDVDIETDLSIQYMLTDTEMKINIKDFEISGKLSSDSSLPLMISLNESAVIDLAKDTILIPKLTINTGDVKLVTNVSGINISADSQFLGKYALAEFNLNDFFKQLSGAGVVSSDVFDSFSSNGSWKLFKNSLKINNLAIAFDKSTVAGDINIVDLDTLKGAFNLNINSLNVDKFLAEESNSSTSSSSNNSNSHELDFGHLTGTIKIGSMLASGTKMQNITMQVKTNGAKMELDPVKADFYQGSLNTMVRVDAKAEKNKVIVGHSMTKIQAGPLLTDLAGSELMTGLGNLNIDINIDQPFSDIPLKSAHGHIDYSLGDGAIYGIDVFGMMQQALSLLYPELESEQEDGTKKTTFALMLIDADINAGILKTNVLKIESPYLLINGDISIDLVNMTINGTIAPMLLDIPDQLVSDKYKKLLKIAIPVNLSGSLLEPTIKIDAKQLIINSQKERIEKEKDKLKGKLLDSLFGKKKSDKSG